MTFGLKTKHSLSNKYIIQARENLNAKDLICFKLANENEIYFLSEEIKKKFLLNQNPIVVRQEIREIIINQLNVELNLENARIDNIIDIRDKALTGYKLNQYNGNAYIKNIDDEIGEKFFEPINDISAEKNYLNQLSCECNLIVGSCSLKPYKLKRGELYVITPRFTALHRGKGIFDYSLGMNEIMVVKVRDKMNIEDEIGESIISNEDIKLEVFVSIGQLNMSITQLQELLVGDFIDISQMQFPNVQLIYKNRKIATAELVYDEQKNLSIEIKEVLIK